MPRKLSKPKEPTTLHPTLKRIIGEIFLASANPEGLTAGIEERIIHGIIDKGYPWVKMVKGRSIQIENDGHNVTIVFMQDGKECKGPI